MQLSTIIGNAVFVLLTRDALFVAKNINFIVDYCTDIKQKNFTPTQCPRVVGSALPVPMAT